MKQRYDLVVIGAGSAGLTAASFARLLEKRVALVEKERIGGDCTWTGCVPSKALLKVARVAHRMRTADRFGLQAVEPEIDLKAVMSHVRSIVSQIYDGEKPEALQSQGIEVYVGSPRFADSYTLIVGPHILSAKTFIICTGASPFIPPIPRLAEVDYYTYKQIFDLELLPKHLMVIGGGPVGVEMAQAFRRLGASVTVVEQESRLLPRDEPEASEVLAQVLEAEGITLRLGVAVARVWRRDKRIHLRANNHELAGDALLVAVGRRPNVEGLGLERAGVRYTKAGVEVDERLRTSQAHIYAAGDVTGGYQFTHHAGWQATIAVRNAFFPLSSKGVLGTVPWTTFTDPAVAHVGLTEEAAREQHGDGVKTLLRPLSKVDRAVAEAEVHGFIKLVYKGNGTLLGATIVAPRAGEMIQEWILAMSRGLKLGDLAAVMHVYPTYTMANMQVSADYRFQWLRSSKTGRLLKQVGQMLG